MAERTVVTPEVSQGDEVCWDSLPDELCDLILNGAYDGDRAFLDPTERMVPRLVCKRWRQIIEHPAPCWVAGHLHKAWLCARPYSQPASAKSVQSAMVRGRLATTKGLLRFVCGPDWSPADVTFFGNPSAGAGAAALSVDADKTRAAGTVGKTSASRRVKSALGKIPAASRARAMGKTPTAAPTARSAVDAGTDAWVEARVRFYLGLVRSLPKRYKERPNGWIRRNSRLAHYIAGRRPLCHVLSSPAGLTADKLPVAMVRAGCRLAAALHVLFAVAEKNQSLLLTNVIRLARATINAVPGPHSDCVESLFMVLHALRHPLLEPPIRSTDATQVRRCAQIWETLSDVAAVRCIRALSDAIDCADSKARAKSLQDMLDRSLADAPTPLLHSFANMARVRNVLKAARDAALASAVARIDTLVTKGVMPRALGGADPVGVAVVHRAPLAHVKHLFCGALWMGLFSVAHQMVERFPGLLQTHDAMGTAIGCARDPRAVAEWALGHGFVPSHAHIAAILESGVSTLQSSTRRRPTTDTTLMQIVMALWPQSLLNAPDAVRAGVLRMVQDGRWDDADGVLVALWKRRSHRLLDASGLSADALQALASPVFATDTLWHMLGAGTVSVHRLQSTSVDDAHYPHKPPSCRAALAMLADRCYPDTNPLSWEAWCHWCGAPTPIEASPSERRTMALARRDLLY